VLRIVARMNVGGPALQVVGLTRGLDPGRFESRLLTGYVGPGEADYLELRAPDVPVHRVVGLGRSPNVLGDVRALAAIGREIARFGPDIVHTHTAKAGALGRLAARWRRVPITVHTFHGHLLHGYFSPRTTKMVVHAERGLARMTTQLVAVGSRVRDDLVDASIGRADQYEVVAPGVALPPPPTRAEARSMLGLPAQGPVVAFVARLTNVKRPDRLVEVSRRVAVSHPEVTFAIAGEGELLDATRKQAADLGANVRFLGWRRDVETVYAAADLVLLTSDNEGMPVSLIEAATVGRPAVTTAVGSAGEVVDDGVTGFVVPASVDALAGAVVRLLDDQELTGRMGAAAAERANRLFSAARLVEQTEALYERLAARRGLP
jgi:glycosyltransferase involved in cell wall biosynthesis